MSIRPPMLGPWTRGDDLLPAALDGRDGDLEALDVPPEPLAAVAPVAGEDDNVDVGASYSPLALIFGGEWQNENLAL